MRTIIVLFSLFIFTAQNIYATQEVGEYVYKLVDEVSSMLADKSLKETEKVTKSKELLAKNLNFDWMANYALGNNKKSLSEQQIQGFHGLYSEYVIKSYSSLVKNYNGEKTTVKKVREIDADGEYIVNTTVAKPGGQPIKVDYLVMKKGTNFKVSDIITEGVSLINSQQNEFNGIIKNQGFDNLLKKMHGNPSQKNKN